MKASKRHIMDIFEEETKDWGYDYTKIANATADEGIAYADYDTGQAFGLFRLGWTVREDRDPTNAWLKTRGH